MPHPDRLPIVRRWRAILRARPDTEHEMMPNRLVFAGAVIGYLMIASAAGHHGAFVVLRTVYPGFIVYFLCAIALLAHILYRPAPSPARRIVAALYDFAMISYAAHACGTSAGFFYPLLLWTVFGNGFRFGVIYLFISAGIAVTDFAVVLVSTGFWHAQPGFSAALLLGLVILPAYVARLIQKLSDAKHQAEEASKAKSRFLASVSHELRTPLNAIIGLSGLLEESRLDQTQEEMVQTVGDAGRTLLRLINSILDLSRIEAGKMPRETSEFDLYELVTHVRNMVAVLAREKQLLVSVHITPRVPRLIMGHRQHLEEILLNLVANAVKFTAEGYVVIALDATQGVGEKARLRFEISDTGIGIAPEAQERVFESFTQADETIVDRYGGTGLGLALCKQLVELQGGTIGVQSSLGAGSTFWFEIEAEHWPASDPALPYPDPIILVGTDERVEEILASLASDVRVRRDWPEAAAELDRIGYTRGTILFDGRADDGHEDEAAFARCARVRVTGREDTLLLTDRQRSHYTSIVWSDAPESDFLAVLQIAAAVTAPKPHRKEQAVEPAGRKLTVLVAEDNRTNQLVLTKILERAGHASTVVEDGAAALEALCSRRFDVALVDVNMPIMNGIEAARRYRQHVGEGAGIAIIALTADATPETSALCTDAGMFACATKPIEPHRLLELLQRAAAEHLVDGAAVPLAPDLAASEAPAAVKAAPLAGERVNAEVIRNLEQLGGRAFLRQLIEEFIEDSGDVLPRLSTAVAEVDAPTFGDELHALRSAAGNIGARSLFDLCLTLRAMTQENLAANGASYLKELETEITSVQADLRALLDVYPAEESAG